MIIEGIYIQIHGWCWLLLHETGLTRVYARAQGK